MARTGLDDTPLMNLPPPVIEVQRRPPEAIPVTGVLQAGSARVDLTPGFLSSLAGWGPTLATSRRTRAAWGRLFARVLVLDDGQGERVALIAADLHAATRYVTERLAEHTAALGLHVGRLFLAGTHTHSGPGNFYANTYYDTFAQTEPLLKEQGLDPVMVDYLVERLGLGVREACARLRPARVGHGVARLWRYSRNRSLGALRENFPGLDDSALRQRVSELGFPSGTLAVSPPDLPLDQVCVDPRIQVLWAEEADAPHRPIGAFGTFGAHASLLAKEHPMCSPDFFGVATRHAEHLLRGAAGEPGPVVALAAGAIGDSDAARPGMTLEALKKAREDRTQNLSLMEEVGRAVGAQLAKACEDARTQVKASLRITALFDEPTIRDATLKDGRRLPTAALVGAPTLRGSEMGGGVTFFKEGERLEGLPDTDPQWPKAPPRALERLIRESLKYQPHTLPLRLLKVGDLWLMGCPGEPTSWLAHELTQTMLARGAREVMVAGVCGDYAGYLTTEREYKAQHYEGSSTLWGRNTEPWLLERFDALALSATTAIPSGAARFTIKPGKHQALTQPQPPTSEFTPSWPRPPELAAPRISNGRLVLAGRWFAWAPQERGELGWGAWIRLEDADSGEQLHSANRPLDDQHHTFLLEFIESAGVLEWRWMVVLDDWEHLRGRKIRFRTQGPRGVSVRPPPGARWPEANLLLNMAA
ncbi:neutral/alkaline non-lysosomal ceramidase N-terminal domain-containing protein [Archangium lansingense]|uniref:neutral/alkaline non-lysosomal ceramidase N-terminal domain-containing protein n=1 Tax=Archangium lansingense TaxID=2995310 RepID=UPI003B7E2F34